MPSAQASRVSPANRLALDYRAEAAALGAPPAPIIDTHAHINGVNASRLYDEVRQLFGVTRTYSMTQFAQTGAVRDALGDSVHFIAVPSYLDEDRGRLFREGFLEAIQSFHAIGSRIVKFWAAPRSRDYAVEAGDATLALLDNEWRLRAMTLAESLGMMFITHVADPDTWFQGKYTDVSQYGTKPQQYLAFERMLDRFTVPWIAAHMGGWPEDLTFLDGLLTRHDNLHLDTAATKWMVRELSKQPRDELVAFLEKWSGRVLFGSDIVTTDEHLSPGDGPRNVGAAASSRQSAFELYASRYWALRTLFETDYDGESPIADPDLAMVEPDRYGPMSAPRLVGKSLPPHLLRTLYHDAACNLLDRWRLSHTKGAGEDSDGATA